MKKSTLAQAAALAFTMSLTACPTPVDNNTNPNNTNNEPCDKSCTPKANECQGDKAITYTSTLNAETCTCEEMQQETDCAVDAKVCSNAQCVDAESPCASTQCDMPTGQPSCDGDVAVTFPAVGTCDDATGEAVCSYDEIRTDCAESNQECFEGACRAPMMNNDPVAPAAGEIVITELFFNAVGTDDGKEWIELYNTSDKAITLKDTKIKDGGNEHVINADLVVMPKAYALLGRSDMADMNGGITPDYIYGGFNLNNDGEPVTLTLGDDTEITTVDYSMFTLEEGRSVQFNGEKDASAEYTITAADWCVAPTQWDAANDSAYGSPGAANPPCAAPLPEVTTTIPVLQDPNAMMRPPERSPVILNDVVLTALSDNGEFGWVQDKASGAWSGIYLDLKGVTLPDPRPALGAQLNIKGEYREIQDRATITVTEITDLGMLFDMLPVFMDSADFKDPMTAEKWEGVLVSLTQPGVTNENADGPANDFQEFVVNDAARVNDLLFQPAMPEAKCDVYAFIVGVVDYSFGNYKVEPRSAADFGMKTALTPQEMLTLDINDAAATGGIAPAASCVYRDATVTFDNKSAASVTIKARNEVGPGFGTGPLDATVAAGMQSTPVALAAAGSVRFGADPGMATGLVVVLDEAAPVAMCNMDNTKDANEACDGTDLAGQDCTTVPGGFTGGTLSCSTSCTFDTSACTRPPSTNCLIISQYLENTGAYKMLEIYNKCPATTVDLSGYSLCLMQNDGNECDQNVTLSSGTKTMLNGNDTLVVCRDNAEAAVLAICDVQANSVMNHNGDDRFAIYKHIGNALDLTMDTIVDAFGELSVNDAADPFKDKGFDRCNFADYLGAGAFNITTYFREYASGMNDITGFGVAPTAGCP